MGTITGVFNVADYGATGNGTTDDHAAITSAITAASTNGTVFFPPGTFRTSHPLQPLTGQRWIGSGMCSDDSPGTPGTILTYNPSSDTANFIRSAVVDGLQPGVSQPPISSVDDVYISDMLINAQAQAMVAPYTTGDYAGCMRIGERWRVERVHFYDGHYFHCLIGGNSAYIHDCEFSLGDAYQDTVGGGGSYHDIGSNRWNANCSYGANQNGSDHNAYDNCGQTLSQYTPVTPNGFPAVGVNFHDNHILSNQTVYGEAWWDSTIHNNQFTAGGNVTLQSNTRYGYSTFNNCQRVTISNNIFSGSTSTRAQDPIAVFLETVAAPNTGTQSAGGCITITGNSLYEPQTCGIVLYGDGATSTSFGGTKITNNTIYNGNVQNQNGTVTYEGAYTYTAAIAIIGGWNHLLVANNACIDSRSQTLSPAISYGNGATPAKPPGGALFANNITVGVGDHGRTTAIQGFAPASGYAAPVETGNFS